MLDINFIPGQQDNVTIFYGRGTTTWQTWNKPRNCKFIWMMCIGGGAAGTNGLTGGSRGSGGGSGAITRALFPASVLPDILYIQPGTGGKTPSADGSRSFVSIIPSSAAIMNIVCTSGAIAAALASGETIAAVANMGLVNLGIFNSVAGFSNNGAYLTFSILSGGGNGSDSTSEPVGVGFASINLGNNIVTPTIAGGSGTTGVKGADGVWNWKPMYGLGGAGGGYSTSGIGGAGGNGAYGCGGGGGGTGTITGAPGGQGGDGLVIIATF